MTADCIGVILAGGRSSRMGEGDKAFRELNDKTLIEHVIQRARPQVNRLILSTNSANQDAYQQLGLTSVTDCLPGRQGPLSGILSAMKWIEANRPECQWLASFATDTPFIPNTLVEHLMQEVTKNDTLLAYAASNNRRHPVIGLWSQSLLADLEEQLLQHDVRKVESWTQRHSPVQVSFAADKVDPFFNINTPNDLQQAQQILKSFQ